MADEIDFAQDWEMRLREQQIAQASRGEVLPAIGACYFCDEPLGEGHRFCDADCRDGWAAEQAARVRNGTQLDDD